MVGSWGLPCTGGFPCAWADGRPALASDSARTKAMRRKFINTSLPARTGDAIIINPGFYTTSLIVGRKAQQESYPGIAFVFRGILFKDAQMRRFVAESFRMVRYLAHISKCTRTSFFTFTDPPPALTGVIPKFFCFNSAEPW